MPVTIDQPPIAIDNTFDYAVTITETNVDVVAISQTIAIDNTFDYTYDITIVNESPVSISKTHVIDNTFDYTLRIMVNRLSFNTRQTMNVQPGVGFQTLIYPDQVYKSHAFRWLFKMVEIVDYATPLIISPASITVAISTHGGAFVVVTETIYSVGDGWYYIDIPIAYMVGSVIALRAYGTGLYTSDEVIYLHAFASRNIVGHAVITNDFDYGYTIEVA
jgi:hypothetical protein